MTANAEAGYSVSAASRGYACLKWSSDGGATWNISNWASGGYCRVDLPADCSEILVKGGFERSAVTVSVDEGVSGGTVYVSTSAGGLKKGTVTTTSATTTPAGGSFYAKVVAGEGMELRSAPCFRYGDSVVTGLNMNSGDDPLGEEYADIWKFTVPEERLDGTVTAEFASKSAPDTITTAAELKLLADEVNDGESKAGKTYTLGADIDLSGIDWQPIGGEAVAFAGTFDGAGRSVTGLSVNSSAGYAGLFGNVSGAVKDFAVSGSVSSSAANADYVGGVAGKLSEGGTISGVTANVTVTAENCYNVGGIVGFNGTKGAMTSAENTVIENCANNGAVVGCSQVGGIAGENAGIIKACANTGKIDATKTSSKNGTGGIAGRNGCNNTVNSKGTILDCYNTGEVGRSGMKWVGGITGLNNAASTIGRCYNTGAAHGTNQTNPLVGRNEASSASHPGAGVHDCWYLDSTKVADESGVFDADGADASVNCGSKTADEMKSAEFVLLLNGERTGDAAVWNADAFGDDAINGGFPVFAWQGGAESAVDSEPWDGKTIDVSWYNTTDTSFYIGTPAQLMGLAAIVNGAVNSDITTVVDADAEGAAQTYALADYMAREDAKIKKVWFEDPSTYGGSQNGWCGADNFNGKVVYLTADLDMGGAYDAEAGTWGGARFMPIGCKACLDVAVDASASSNDENWISSVFSGSLDGQGYWVNNIYTGSVTCSEWCADVALIGLLGAGEGQEGDSGVVAVAPFVRNVVVGPGYIEADRSVGGVVGKVGKTNGTAVIENCANYATIVGHQKKGTGGVVGAAWNDLVVKNCYNAGSVSGFQETGGVCGSNEADVVNCYNIGKVSCSNAKYGGAVAYSNGGDSYTNCYWLTGSAPNGVDKKSNADATEKTSDEMKTAEFLVQLNGTGRAWVADNADNPVNDGYPILRVMAGSDTATVTGVSSEGVVQTSYVEGQKFSAASQDGEGNDTSFKIWASYSDGTRELVEGYSVTLGDSEEALDLASYTFAPADSGKTLTMSGTVGGTAYSFTSAPISVEKNVPLEIVTVSGTPSNLTFAVGQEIPQPTNIRVKFSNGTTSYIRATNPDDWANVKTTPEGALTAASDGATLAV